MTFPVTGTQTGGSTAMSGMTATANSAATTGATGTPSMPSGFDAQTFLQLLVAQLKYQDPMNPTNPSDLLAQTAQMYSVEALNQLLQTQQGAATNQATLMGTSLIGKTVTATDPQGKEVTGVVSAVKVSTAGLDVEVTSSDGSTSDVSLSQISKVAATPAPAPTTSAPAGN